MSRTIRNKRPKMRLGYLVSRQYKNGKVRDGTPQHVSPRCGNHGGCPYCESNKTHKTIKRMPIIYDENKDVEQFEQWIADIQSAT